MIVDLNNDWKTKICDELNILGAKSVILLGSRAGNIDKCSKNSDYDIYVVTPTLALPIMFWRLRKKEKILERKLGTKVSAKPLSIHRIEHGKDLLLLKTKKEGITLSGENYLNKICIDGAKDLCVEDIFAYFFSGVLFLAENFEPSQEYLVRNKDALARSVSKAVLYFAEVTLLMDGNLTNNRNDICSEVLIGKYFKEEDMKILQLSIDVLNNNCANMDIVDFWFAGRRVAVNIFTDMCVKYYGPKTGKFEELIDTYNHRYTLLKRIQHLTHFIIGYDKYPFRMISGKRSLECIFQAHLLYLVLSVETDLSINSAFLNKASVGMNGMIKIESSKKDTWNSTKYCLSNYWTVACAKNAI